MTQTIRTHVPVPGLGPDCDVHCRTELNRLSWLGVYSHERKTWIFPRTQQSVTAALTAAKVVLR